jgi:RNA polymerase sigma factor (sigma-70 family)
MNAPTTATSLLSRVRDPNDSDAWRQFDARYRELLLRFCYRQGLQPADAEDVVQSVFAKLAKTLPEFIYDRERGRFRDYLLRCVKGALHDWAEKPGRRWSPLRSSMSGSSATGSFPGADGNELVAAWEEEWVAHHYRLALETVRRTFEARSVEIFDRCIDGAAVSDLARQYEITEQAVHKVRQRIRDRMQELIAQQIREEDE